MNANYQVWFSEGLFDHGYTDYSDMKEWCIKYVPHAKFYPMYSDDVLLLENIESTLFTMFSLTFSDVIIRILINDKIDYNIIRDAAYVKMPNTD